MPDQEIPEPCATCGGPYDEGCVSGMVKGAGGAWRPCSQWEARKAERRLAAAQVPELYSGRAFDDFRVDLPRGARQLAANRDACRAYAERFVLKGGARAARGLILVGPPGSGKTFLLAAVLQAVIRRTGARGRFVDFTALCAALQASFDDKSTSEAQIMQPLMDAEILGLDDLGARRPTPYVQDTLYLLLNARCANRRPTLFTSNHPLEVAPGASGREATGFDRPMGGAGRSAGPEASFEPLAVRVGPRIYSRLFEMTEPALSFDQAGDYRQLPPKPLTFSRGGD